MSYLEHPISGWAAGSSHSSEPRTRETSRNNRIVDEAPDLSRDLKKNARREQGSEADEKRRKRKP
eukprot:2999006-Pyramimonas_sp.AAC.1